MSSLPQVTRVESVCYIFHSTKLLFARIWSADPIASSLSYPPKKILTGGACSLDP
jgi:hypothetical protein